MNPMPRTLGILPAAITALFLVAYHGKEKPVPPSVPEPQAAPDSRTTVVAALADGAVRRRLFFPAECLSALVQNRTDYSVKWPRIGGHVNFGQ